jgi:glutamine amidotransferase
MAKIIIVDLGTGNLRSVSKALEHVASDGMVEVSADPRLIEAAEFLVLPGQGAIGTWMNQLQQYPELEVAVRTRLDNGPALGICLGLQALYDNSEENGGTTGLGILPGSVRHFSVPGRSKGKTEGGERLKIPHMGWNQVSQCRDHPLWQGIKDNERFYFVHSYYSVVAGYKGQRTILLCTQLLC